ncbi:MAG: hypothetical protein A3F83_01190 [Candidatus Glassbacteria bacterium RIFCSPLOWO2_12_FULL_58_11]|uniref:Uncharacterized protein n=1 Tax=Candidatus Glassbacteria bacterium RIFCSPLOWO2_12_FULL_58_11 TaxID=1817867 RepID=A0A1F5YZ23_9BACT|nr:MAG: hypothetical protein A3F83_01190 [Candidatus Glassbacteria bacterium RIFCSPLOWO2_12_FULL_58_11]
MLMQVIVPGIVILILIVILYIRVSHQRALMEAAAAYEARLREARLIRGLYLQALDKSREVLKESEQLNGNLNALREEIYSLRSEGRDNMRALRHTIQQSTGSALDKRTIEQMKLEFSEKWKYYDVRKRSCRDLRTSVRMVELRKEDILKTELTASQKWLSEKEQVMLLWRELSPKIKITDPHHSFN